MSMKFSQNKYSNYMYTLCLWPFQKLIIKFLRKVLNIREGKFNVKVTHQLNICSCILSGFPFSKIK